MIHANSAHGSACSGATLPTLSTLTALARTLNVTVNDLI